jgi:hypothetical protein
MSQITNCKVANKGRHHSRGTASGFPGLIHPDALESRSDGFPFHLAFQVNFAMLPIGRAELTLLYIASGDRGPVLVGTPTASQRIRLSHFHPDGGEGASSHHGLPGALYLLKRQLEPFCVEAVQDCGGDGFPFSRRRDKLPCPLSTWHLYGYDHNPIFLALSSHT